MGCGWWFESEFSVHCSPLVQSLSLSLDQAEQLEFGTLLGHYFITLRDLLFSSNEAKRQFYPYFAVLECIDPPSKSG